MKYLALIFLMVLTSCNFEKSESSDKHILKQVENSKEKWNTTTYYLIRHAEKDRSNPSEKDPKLTEEGKKRAENWKKVLEEVPFDMIYSTKFNRTKETAEPIAKAKNLEVEFYDSEDMYNLEFQQKTKGKTVLIVGHSNTTPAFANAIIKKQKYSDLPDDENGGLFIISITPTNRISSQVLYIN